MTVDVNFPSQQSDDRKRWGVFALQLSILRKILSLLGDNYPSLDLVIYLCCLLQGGRVGSLMTRVHATNAAA